MTAEKTKHLETLLLELRQEIGAPVIVVPEYEHDGTLLVVYDESGRSPKFQICKPDLDTCLSAYDALKGKKQTSDE